MIINVLNQINFKYMTKISSFEKVIQQYDAIFFDAFGVLKNYNGLIEGVAETIYKLHNDQKQIFILTYPPPPPPPLSRRFAYIIRPTFISIFCPKQAKGSRLYSFT